MKKRSSLFFGIIFLCLLLSGCGYTTRSLLPAHLRTIHVKPFKNRIAYGTEKSRNIYFPLLEVEITNVVINRFLFDGNLRITDEDTADLILAGELLNYERNPLRYFDDTGEVQEYRINMTVSLELWESVDEKLRWREPSFVGETTYFTSGSLAKTESAAVDDALVDLARRIIERTVEDW